mmetsp:Transcript_43047/g.51653  ORF Transcript_43047/g.51653 Transcript_43047/m.51653 type:complete len:96 (-) Transcript_43047:502-789(-)
MIISYTHIFSILLSSSSTALTKHVCSCLLRSSNIHSYILYRRQTTSRDYRVVKVSTSISDEVPSIFHNIRFLFQRSFLSLSADAAAATLLFNCCN